MAYDGLAASERRAPHRHGTRADHHPDRRPDAQQHADRGRPGADGPGGGDTRRIGFVGPFRTRSFSVVILSLFALALALACVAAYPGGA